jgi:predicted TIM-barrel fold metal-dependent hydrolase
MPAPTTMPTDIGIIDCMLGIPDTGDRSAWYESFRPLLKDGQSRDQFKMPAQYMFKDIPDTGPGKSTPADFVRWTVEQMDRFNIKKALVGCNEDATSEAARTLYPDRFFFDAPCNPNNGMDEVRRIRRLHRDYGIKAISVFPAGTIPQVAINHKYMFPLYSVACELDIPILLNVGIPGPRIPMETQKVEHLDEVCWFFPDLKVVMRHGAEPWEALAVKLMLKYPNLYYSTSAFAPKHYPRAIIDYANTRGADKIIYAGYFPMGLSLDRIFADMPGVPFKAEVWPKFLRGNAMKLFGLED